MLLRSLAIRYAALSGHNINMQGQSGEEAWYFIHQVWYQQG